MTGICPFRYYLQYFSFSGVLNTLFSFKMNGWKSTVKFRNRPLRIQAPNLKSTKNSCNEALLSLALWDLTINPDTFRNWYSFPGLKKVLCEVPLHRFYCIIRLRRILYVFRERIIFNAKLILLACASLVIRWIFSWSFNLFDTQKNSKQSASFRTITTVHFTAHRLFAGHLSWLQRHRIMPNAWLKRIPWPTADKRTVGRTWLTRGIVLSPHGQQLTCGTMKCKTMTLTALASVLTQGILHS